MNVILSWCEGQIVPQTATEWWQSRSKMPLFPRLGQNTASEHHLLRTDSVGPGNRDPAVSGPRTVAPTQTGQAAKTSESRGERDYYAILGVVPSASPADIRAAYHLLAREWHPDTGATDVQSVARIKLVNEAYSVLSDQEKRQCYDRRIQPGSCLSAFVSNPACKMLFARVCQTGLEIIGSYLIVSFTLPSTTLPPTSPLASAADGM